MQLLSLLSILLSGRVPTETFAFSGAQEHRWKWISYTKSYWNRYVNKILKQTCYFSSLSKSPSIRPVLLQLSNESIVSKDIDGSYGPKNIKMYIHWNAQMNNDKKIVLKTELSRFMCANKRLSVCCVDWTQWPRRRRSVQMGKFQLPCDLQQLVAGTTWR